MSLFKAENLECTRRDNILFQDINFQLGDGDLLQFDGVNGSGKSSLMQICTGLMQPTEGAIYWNDESINDCRYEFQRNVCYVGHHNAVKAGLTALENMQVMHALSGSKDQPDYETILEQVGLPGMEDVSLNRMSAGQQRRIGLTRIFMTRAKLWLLDEPFNALDKHGKEIIETLIVQHCRNGGMAIFATHQAMEIDAYDLKHIHLGRRHD